jgi:hypothetical protein
MYTQAGAKVELVNLDSVAALIRRGCTPDQHTNESQPKNFIERFVPNHSLH